MQPKSKKCWQRSSLIAQLKREVNNADGTLTYGVAAQAGQGNAMPYFQHVVRVDDSQAQINQAETGIEWSLSASYSLFPNECGYATTDFTLVEPGRTRPARVSSPQIALRLVENIRSTVFRGNPG